MKKILTGAIIASALLVTPSFANSELTKIMPISTIAIEDTSIDNSDIIIRNNNLQSDYKYNGTHYYTTKLASKDIVIPEDIKKDAKKIYFLVEEGQSRVYYSKGFALEDSIEIDEVKKEYNYKIVEYKAGQKEYIFDNQDLLKEFGEDKYQNVQITLMAEMKDGKKVALSNTAYVSINDKKSVLDQLKRDDKDNGFYFGYYNRDDLEVYLEKIALKMTRSEYKAMLQKADRKIKASAKKNEANMKTIIDSINKEADFVGYVDDYRVYTETNALLSGLGNAVNNQIQNIRAFDAIDAILK